MAPFSCYTAPSENVEFENMAKVWVFFQEERNDAPIEVKFDEEENHGFTLASQIWH